MSLNLNQCDKACFECIKSYKCKHKLKTGQKFDIKCKGIPSEQVQLSLLSRLPEEERQTARAMIDPVVWAAETLDWHCLDPDGSIWQRKNPEEYAEWRRENPNTDIYGKSRYHRPYQAEMLRCLHGDTIIFMADGTVKTIKDINIGDKVITYNENKKTTQSSYTVLNKWNNGVRDIYKIELNNGDILKVTSNHPILSWFHEGKLNQLVNKKSFRRVYKSLEDGLSVGDKVYTLNQFELFGQESNIHAARLMGYIVSDGYVQNSGELGEKHVVEFRNIRQQYVEEFANLVESVFGVDRPTVVYHPSRIDKNGVHHKEHWSTAIYGKNHILLATLREIGCTNKTNRELSLLKFAFLYNREALSNFLNRCWAGDGCIYNQNDHHLNHLRSYISLSSGNREYLELFRILLKKVGIYTSHIYIDQKTSSTALSLSISRIEDIEKFLSFTGPIFGKEQQCFIALEQTVQRNSYRRHGNLKTLSRTSIKRIQYVGKEEVWDIEVDKRHNFVANGIIVHNCNSRRKVFRIGRQCLVGDTEVTLRDGSVKLIKDIQPGDQIATLDICDLSYSTVINQWNAGVKKVFKIKTKFGKEILCTSDHRFYICNDMLDNFHGLTIDDAKKEWLSIDTGLKIGSKIAVPSYAPHQKSHQLGSLAPFLGYFLSDGSCSKKQSAKFTNINMQYLLEFEALSKDLGSAVKWYQKNNGYDLIISNGQGVDNPVRNLLTELGLTNITGPEKFIPECLINASDKDVIAFLRTFWAGDGYVSTFKRTNRDTYRTEIGTLQESLLLIQQLQKLLYRFGVHGHIKKEDNCYRLVVSNKFSIKNFLLEIGPIPGKEDFCEKAYSNIETVSDKYCYTQNDILWDYVSEITEVGMQETFDIEVKDTHNFIANNIYTHNSGKTETIVVSMLYHMFTKPNIPEEEGFEIVVITPYQSQIDLIFNRMLQLIRSSPVTNNSLRRNVKAPIYQIQLHNESVVKGFTAGTKSGGNADAVRGQHAHMLVFDEADYLSAGDMDSALSIITNYPSASMWMSSTPSGKREKFYHTCYSPLFKEFYYPSQVNPMWNEQLEALFKEQLTEIGFKHEVLGEFGEQEEGVFQNVYVQAAKAPYKYGDKPYYNVWTYSIGVDWNDTKNGTTIVVVGFDPARTKFVVVDRQIVSRDGWTQTLACQKIAELNRIWRPAFIYLDAGFGGTQWEILRKYGYDSIIDPTKGPTHPDARLKDIIKKYDFGSKVEVRDLFTHQPIQKDAKPFLVENIVRRFEAHDIQFAENDEILERQLLGYVIDRITPTGRPVYKAGDETAGDHILDALMLAMIGFTLEVSPLGKPKYSSRIQISGKFGEGNMPDIHTGDTVIHPYKKRKEDAKELRERVRPAMNRTTTVGGEQLTLFSGNTNLPAYNTNRESNTVKPWRHDGFMRDEPIHRVRTLAEAESDAKNRLGIRRRITGRPRRKNI